MASKFWIVDSNLNLPGSKIYSPVVTSVHQNGEPHCPCTALAHRIEGLQSLLPLLDCSLLLQDSPVLLDVCLYMASSFPVSVFDFVTLQAVWLGGSGGEVGEL